MNITTVTMPYAWLSYRSNFLMPGEKLADTPEDEIYCAWCHKTKAEIRKTEDPDKHIEEHDKED